VRPDIWYWTNEYTKDLIPEQQRILHLVEVKSCWGGVYEQTIEKESGNTIDTCRSKANLKYRKAVEILYEMLKAKLNTKGSSFSGMYLQSALSVLPICIQKTN
jgi:hypothetical protein